MSSVKLAAAVGLLAGGAVLFTEHLLTKTETPATLANIADGLLDTLEMGAQVVTRAVETFRDNHAAAPAADAGTDNGRPFVDID